uniref:Uncharacterized protein n=1 Tax=Arundo donax TaxID=35708 RepID=A0A0A9A7T0_ARUDO
MSMYVIGF